MTPASPSVYVLRSASVARLMLGSPVTPARSIASGSDGSFAKLWAASADGKSQWMTSRLWFPGSW